MKTRKLLKSVAEELIKVMILTDKDAEGNSVPIVIRDSMDIKAIEEFVKDAVLKIEPGDAFTKETIEIIKEYGGDVSIITEEKPISIEDEIADAETIKELKEIALAEPQFKVIRGKLASFKTVDDLREEMIWLFTNTKVPTLKEETQEEVAERLHKELEKEPVKKPVLKVEKAKKLTEEELEKVELDPEDNYPENTELLGLGTMKTKNIVTIKPFNGLFNIDEKVFQAVLEDMKVNGFDHAFPIVVWGDVVLDGHTRLEAAELLEIKEVPILRKEFKNEKEALEYSIHNQRDRRNLSDAELLRCIEAIDTPMTKAEAGKKGGSKSEVKTASVKSHKETAKKLGVGETKVTDARVVLTDEETKEEVLAGKKTIAKAAKEIRGKRSPSTPKKEKKSRIQAICQAIKMRRNSETMIEEILDEAYLLFKDATNPGAMEKAFNIVLEVLIAVGVVTKVDDETIKIEEL